MKLNIYFLSTVLFCCSGKWDSLLVSLCSSNITLENIIYLYWCLGEESTQKSWALWQLLALSCIVQSRSYLSIRTGSTGIQLPRVSPNKLTVPLIRYILSAVCQQSPVFVHHWSTAVADHIQRNTSYCFSSILLGNILITHFHLLLCGVLIGNLIPLQKISRAVSMVQGIPRLQRLFSHGDCG